LQYTGRESDAETGIYYYRARYYDPATGRFISEDPTGFGGGLNFFQYARNNATLFNDPLGLWINSGIQAPPDINTIVCNGKGGIRVQLADYYNLLPDFRRCLADCTRMHENLHIKQALSFNAQICRGSADGIQVTFSNGIEQDVTEIAAYTLSIKCLEEKKKKEKCSHCRDLQQGDIDTALQKIKDFKWFLKLGI